MAPHMLWAACKDKLGLERSISSMTLLSGWSRSIFVWPKCPRLAEGCGTISPSVGDSSPAKQFNKVDFPLPLAPIIPMRSFLPMENEISEKILFLVFGSSFLYLLFLTLLDLLLNLHLLFLEDTP